MGFWRNYHYFSRGIGYKFHWICFSVKLIAGIKLTVWCLRFLLHRVTKKTVIFIYFNLNKWVISTKRYEFMINIYNLRFEIKIISSFYFWSLKSYSISHIKMYICLVTRSTRKTSTLNHSLSKISMYRIILKFRMNTIISHGCIHCRHYFIGE